MGNPFLDRKAAGPPAEVTPSALFRALSDRARPHLLVPCPRLDDDGKPLGEYWLQVLTQSEVDDARIDAERYVARRAAARKTERDLGEINQEAWRDMYSSALMVELIYRAARDATDASRPLFSSPEEIRKALTSDEIVGMVNAYDALQHRFGPLWRTFTDDEVDQWVDTLAKGAEDLLGPLSSLSQGALAQLIVSMARLLAPSPTAKSSAGSVSSTGSTSTP